MNLLKKNLNTRNTAINVIVEKKTHGNASMNISQAINKREREREINRIIRFKTRYFTYTRIYDLHFRLENRRHVFYSIIILYYTG